MINITLVATVIDNKIIFKEESEVENLALEIIGYADNLYSEEVPIANNVVIRWNKMYNGWVLETRNSDRI